MGFGRLLNDNIAVEHFLQNCLDIAGKNVTIHGSKSVPLSTLASKIRDAELLQAGTGEDGTFSSFKNRLSDYRSKSQRSDLREQIVRELLELERLDDDEEIKLGVGGAKPKGAAVTGEKQAFLITGLPASGKSSIVAKIADTHGAYVIDPDYSKRKIPEFDGTMAGANLVHEESSAITLSAAGYEGPSLLPTCLTLAANIVRPMVGANMEKLSSFRDLLIQEGYAVHLTTIMVDRCVAARRAIDRFIKTDRYVSLGYIFDDCANDPALVYYRYRMEACVNSKSPWASVGALSTEGEKPIRLDTWGADNPASLF